MLHLSPEQIAQVEEMVNLLDEGFYTSVGKNALHQQVDGNVEFVISLGNTLDRARGISKVESTVVVYSSMMAEGQSRLFFASIEEALEAVKKWHQDLVSVDVRVSEERPQLRVVK
jgi:hypothetical protein